MKYKNIFKKILPSEKKNTKSKIFSSLYSINYEKEERQQIFELFLTKTKLKFNEIEKQLKVRSNMLSYHIDKMVKDNLLEKRGFYYSLTMEAEKYIPLFSRSASDQLHALPIILIAVVKNKDVLLLKREKRPYKGYWGVIGGKLRLHETVEDASIRLVKEKTGLNPKFISVNAVIQERVFDSKNAKHNYIHIFTVVKPLAILNSSSEKMHSDRGELKWIALKEISKEKIMDSDKHLIKNHLKTKLQLKLFDLDDNEGEVRELKKRNS